MKLIITLTFSLIAVLSQAQDVIENYEVTLQVKPDRSVEVEEKITVNVTREGDIEHGITRDIPNVMLDSIGYWRYPVGVLEVKRNGNSEPYSASNKRWSHLIKIGDPDIELTANNHTYLIRYRMKEQIRFFDDHDELYFNVIGHYWNFSIEKAGIRVILPEEVNITEINSYSGPMGDTGSSVESTRINDYTVDLSLTEPLEPREGITVSLAWPKGIITAPTPEELAQNRKFIFRGRKYALWTLYGGLVLVGIYFLFIWYKVGVDPKKEAIIPRWDPPSNLPPSVLGYVFRLGFRDEHFTSTIISLAIKGKLQIAKIKKKYTLTKLESDTTITEDESVVFEKLFSREDIIELDKKGNPTVESAKTELQEYLLEYHKKPYFVQNYGWLMIGILVSMLAFIFSMIYAVNGTSIATTSVLVMVLVFGSITFITPNRSFRFLCGIFGAIFLVFGSIPVFQGNADFTGASVYILGAVALLTLNIVFYYLIPAPTVKGRRLMDEIEGLKLYMETAEKNRLNLMNPPEENLQLFEKLFPYAFALGVDQKWSARFDKILGADYNPHWYHGHHAHFHFGTFSSTISGSFSSSVSSASGSGVSGSGSSGGGSGGGGGGGW